MLHKAHGAKAACHGPNTTMIFGAFHNNEPASATLVGAFGEYLAERSG